MTPRVWAALLAAALLLPAPARAADASVTVANNTFTPQTVTIDPGDSVTWTGPASGAGLHTVTQDNGTDWANPFGTTASHTFPTAGTYGYYCRNHGSPGSGMHGTVVVRAASTSPSPKPSSPKPSVSPSPSRTTTRSPSPSPRVATTSPVVAPSTTAPATVGSPSPSVAGSPSASPTDGTRLEDLPQARTSSSPSRGPAIALALLVALACFGGGVYLLRRRAVAMQGRPRGPDPSA